MAKKWRGGSVALPAPRPHYSVVIVILYSTLLYYDVHVKKYYVLLCCTFFSMLCGAMLHSVAGRLRDSKSPGVKEKKGHSLSAKRAESFQDPEINVVKLPLVYLTS